MKSPLSINFPRFFGKLLLAFCTTAILATVTFAQDLPPTVANLQSIPAGSYVIPMDNTNQAVVSPFNLKAYGLANRLLQNGIPLLWAIKSGKSKDATDFTVAAKRIQPSAVASASKTFSAGPFIVPIAYSAQALPIINAFGNNVAVFETTAAATVDIRYTLTHKPLIAVGIANSGNATIHKNLYDFAMIPNYVDVDDSTVNANTCVTVVTQPHVEATNFINNYKTFVQSGGNLLLQCHAVETYENASAGRFQTTLGWDRDDINTTFTYPNADMPFSQFIGAVDPAPSGYMEDWQLSSGALQNGTFISLQNSGGGNTGHYAATVSKLYNGGAGGMVFELGGHNYGAGGSTLASINGQRMILNAVFQPPTRPQACGIQLGFPLVYGYKSVRMTNDVNGNNQINPGDQITWTVNYVNIGSVGVSNFQIADVLPAGVTFAGPLSVSFAGGVTSATANGSYNGVAPNQNLLGAGAYLAPNGRITVQIPVTINPNLVAPATLSNQTNASGTELNAAIINSDNIDSTTIGTQGTIIPPPAGSVSQTQGAGIDPTTVPIIAAPTAANASVTGSVLSPGGNGISRATVTIYNANTLESRSTMTNQFGYFTFPDLEVGNFYYLSVWHKRYQFPSGIGFSLDEDVTGLQIVAEPAQSIWSPRSSSKIDELLIKP
ncbi:MAG: carboxypeptidase regulatory-like domain-containing protein [Acidobacteria bacterium]|nr:carboxypeptidase regulatory-like domain-containing protein [Acidobacteriota bacterium]